MELFYCYSFILSLKTHSFLKDVLTMVNSYTRQF